MTTSAPPIVEAYTQAALNHEIWERVGGDNNCTVHEAIQLLYEELLEHGDWRELWRFLGRRMLYEIENAERSHRHLFGTTKGEDGTRLEDGVSWRQKYKDGTASCWDLLWPIGTTGVRKPLGEWTAKDLRDTAKWFASVGATWVQKSNGFAKAAKEVGGKTLAETKLTAETKEFFESMTRCEIAA